MNQPPYGPPGVVPGYAPPPHHSPPTPTTDKSFIASLFDLSFTSFVTTRLLKVVYVFFLVGVGLALLASLGGAFMMIVADSRGGETGAATVTGFVGILAAPFGCVFALIYGRVLFECIAVFFRIAEHLAEINRKTKA